MASAARPWYKRPLALIGVFIAALLVAWLGVFLWEVGHDALLIKSGTLDPVAAIQSHAFSESVDQAIATTDVTPDDIARIENGSNPTLGNPNAKLHIVEFLDYGCPFCQQEAPIIRAFMAKHMDDAYLVIRDFPLVDLHPTAMDDAISARCVFAQGNSSRYWIYYDRLYASQDAQTPADLRGYAEQIGVDLAAYDACVAAKQPQDNITASQQDGLAAGVRGTPTFFFNGIEIQGAIDAGSLEIVAQDVLKHAGN
ncbi:MAG: thioredoxin domain-containing protein [Patescibacteria group bacterium]